MWWLRIISRPECTIQQNNWDAVRAFWTAVSGTPSSYFQGWTHHNHANVRVAPILNSTQYQGSSQTHLIEYSRVMFPSSVASRESQALFKTLLQANQKSPQPINEKDLKVDNFLFINGIGGYNFNWRYEEDGQWRIVQWYSNTDLAFIISNVYQQAAPYILEKNFMVFPPLP